MVYTPVDKVTTQGYDLQFGTNVLGTKRGKFHKRPRPQTCSYRSLLFHQILPKGIILFLNELARRYGDELEAIVSISLHPGTDVSGQAGSLVQRVVRVFKYILVFVASCGDISFFRTRVGPYPISRSTPMLVPWLMRRGRRRHLPLHRSIAQPPAVQLLCMPARPPLRLRASLVGR